MTSLNSPTRNHPPVTLCHAKLRVGFWPGMPFPAVARRPSGVLLILCLHVQKPRDIFLLSYSIPIIIIVFVEGVMVRANANWAAVSLVCLLVFIIHSLSYLKNYFLYLNFIVNVGFGFLLFLLIATSSDYKVFDRINGIQEFSNELKKNLATKSNVVVSDRLLYSNLAYQYKNEKFKLLMPLSDNQKITKHFQIKSSLSKEAYDNFLFIGDPLEISYLENITNIKLLKEYHPKFTSSPIKVYEVIF